MRQSDVILVGGGLANGLIAHFLAELRPDVRFLLLEAGPKLGGNHTWSFQGSDLEESDFKLIQPLISHSWKNYRVSFPKYQRQIEISYHSILSHDFHTKLSARLKSQRRLNCPVAEVGKHHVITEAKETFEADCVIDGRGWSFPPGLSTGYQKFVGQVLKLKEPHGLTAPMIMDATCEQIDGYRFFYLLPFGEKEILIEDTYYSNSPSIDLEMIRSQISAYALARGWEVENVLYEESEALPIPLESFPSRGETLQSGMRLGVFNYTTGYSIADAVKQASQWAKVKDWTDPNLIDEQRWQRDYQMSQRKFYFMLNQLMFKGAENHLRYRILEKFYQLPTATIERFYRSDLTWLDKVRIFSGKPPISLSRAAKTFMAYKKREYAA